jgi:16S rRNA (uracil1498-N3)-methyltransferase
VKPEKRLVTPVTSSTGVVSALSAECEAAEQTGRLDIPAIRAPESLSRIIGAGLDGARLIFCDEAGEAPPLLEALASLPPGPLALLIGPEGGFSPAERSALRSREDTIPVSLGPRILRADTAALVALALAQAGLGDLRS